MAFIQCDHLLLEPVLTHQETEEEEEEEEEEPP